MRVEEMNNEQIAIYRQAIRDTRWELFLERTRKKHPAAKRFRGGVSCIKKNSHPSGMAVLLLLGLALQ